MSNIDIRRVTNRKELEQFVQFYYDLYRGSDYVVPFLFSDEMATLRKDKNPSFECCEAEYFMAFKDGKMVGRVAAIINHRANERWDRKQVRFGWFDFIDDMKVSAALLKAVEDWGRQQGMTELAGPLGFIDTDREGMLVEGFDRRSMFITYYNHPYYNEHLRRLGYVKDVDWLEYLIPIPEEQDKNCKRMSRIAEGVMRKFHLHKVQVKHHSEYKPYIRKAFELVNEAYSPLYGTVELDQGQIDKYADKFIPLINPDFCCLIVNDDDELVSFGVCAPSMAEAMRKSRGRLFPTGWIGVLKALRKNDTIDMFLIAVKPELQGVGINAIVMDHMMQSCMRNGIKGAETGPMLELNEKVQSQWKMFELTPHKRRRCYIKDLD